MIFLREGVSDGPRMHWLAQNMMPNVMRGIRLKETGHEALVRKSLLRDILASSLVAFVTLAPLVEKGHALSAKEANAGLYPLSENRKLEFVEHMLDMIFAKPATN